MGAFISFFLFSTLEGLGIYFMTMATFRLKPFKHINYFLPILAVMVLQSFVLWKEVNYPFLVPVISILLFVLFFTLHLKISLIWSFIITMVGYTAFGFIQWIALAVLYQSTQSMQEAMYGGYILQSVTAVVQLIITYILIRNSIGFIADFDKLRIKLERYITVILIVATIIGLALVSINIKAMVIVMLSFVYFLYFAIRKEREQ